MPDIAFICPEKGGWFDLAQHILTPLGLPQVTIFRETETLPKSAHTQIALGPEGWVPDVCSSQIWRFTDKNQFTESKVTSKNSSSKLPQKRVLTYVKRASREDGIEFDEKEAFDEALFWARERLFKGSGGLQSADVLEWMLFMHLTCSDPAQEGEIYNGIVKAISRRNSSCLLQIEEFSASFARNQNRSWRDQQRSAIEGIYFALLREFDHGEPDNVPALQRKVALRAPALLIAHELLVTDFGSNQGVGTNSTNVAFLEDLLNHSNNALRLISLDIAASLVGLKQLCTKVREILGSPEWTIQNTPIPRMSPDSSGLCFSPLTALRYFMLIQECDPDFRISPSAGCEHQVTENIHWHKTEPASSSSFDAENRFFDENSKYISRSLIDNWRLLHSAPCSIGYQFKLNAENYFQQIKFIEEVWLELFRFMQKENDRPLVRLLPWPFDKTAALSLRYDVDRPVSEAQINNIAGIQQRFFRSNCATWYYFPGDPHLSAQRLTLQHLEQEVGVHLESVTESVRGMGVTHHSAVTSDYWRGNQTIEKLDRLGTEYGEFLASQISIPRPAWISDGSQEVLDGTSGGRIGGMWLTPIAFPLEGSTSDSTLEYFNRLKEPFLDLIATGGHAIISSHPDLEQKILEELLTSLNLANLWIAPTGEVVRRCKEVLAKGNVDVFFKRKDQITLSSKMKMADLNIQVFLPDVEEPINLSVDLTPGIQKQVSYSSLSPDRDY